MACGGGVMRRQYSVKHPDFSHISTHTFRGKRFKLIWRAPRKGLPANDRYRGSCSDPDSRLPGDCEMNIWPKQPDKEILGTAIHESAHACFPSIREEHIEEFEADLMRLLNRMGLNDQLFAK